MPQLSKIRDAVFPIYGTYEVTKFFLLGSMKFFIIFVLTLTRDTKDTLVVTQCGAEAIAFLKVYGVLPSAAAFIALYARMSSNLKRKPLFYATSIPFFLFFICFDVIIYPNASFLQPSLETVTFWIGDNQNTEVIAKIVSNWISALYFVVAEVYSSVSIGILFWKFANDVVTSTQAKRFYPLFAYMSSLGPIFAGQYVVRYASKAPDFATSLRRLTVAIFISAGMICGLHHIINEFVERKGGDTSKHMADNDSDNDLERSSHGIRNTAKKGSTTKPKKQKPTMADSLKFLASSEYLVLMTVLVVGYGLMYNFLEVSWKSLVKEQYPDKLDYQRFMGNFSSLVGTTTFLVIFLGSNIIKVLGWRIGALATPSIMAMIAIPFFACTVFFGIQNNPPVLHAAVMVGSVMILLSRAFKYGLFDPTTQMAYIPLDEESKVKGKAAIDVLGSRIGKSGASFIQQGLILVFGNIISASPVVMLIFYATSITWIGAANRLSVLYAAKTSTKSE